MNRVKNRPTGIIRTLPYASKGDMLAAYRRMMRGLRELNTDDEAAVYIGMSQKPTIEVLHFYLLVGGRIIGRANIAEWLTEQPEMTCWDDSTRTCKFWAVLVAPFSEPPEKIKMRGFQGFRYTEELW
jgi:hypothetical protein